MVEKHLWCITEEKEEEVSLSNLLMRGLYYAQSGFLFRWNEVEDLAGWPAVSDVTSQFLLR